MKLRIGIYMAVLTISCRLPADEPGNLVVRRLDVLPTIGDRIQETGIEDWKNFFAEWGVGWPEGATLRYFPTFGRLVVKNTPQNIELLRGVLATCGIIPSQIEIQMDFVEFKMEGIRGEAHHDRGEDRGMVLDRTALLSLMFHQHFVDDSGRSDRPRWRRHEQRSRRPDCFCLPDSAPH